MGIFTKLNHHQLAKLLSQFEGVPSTNFEARGVAMGTVNTYYKIHHTTGNLNFLKIDEVADRKRLLNELRILALLTKNQKQIGYLTPSPISVKKSKRPFIPHGKKFALLFPEIPGHAVFDLPPAKMKIVGEAIARLHTLPIGRDIKPHRFNLAGQDKVFRQIQGKLADKLPDVFALITAKRRALKTQAPKTERETLLHADLFAENIHWESGHLSGILDFEASGRGNPLFDLGVCLHALCHRNGRFHYPSIKAFLSGYLSIRKLSVAERKYLGYYLDQSAMRFLLTRLRDFELVPGTNKAEPFKDYREFLKRFDENQTLAQKLKTMVI
jgi:homoserine kinase type II